MEEGGGGTLGMELRREAARRGMQIPPEAFPSMETHRRLLGRWNRAVRLTSLTDVREVRERHFLESLEALRFVGPGAGRLVDVGSGNGFPALPLLMARPSLEGILLEPATRKRAFLKEVLRETGLTGRVRVLPDRVDRASDLDEMAPIDYLTVRAVGGLDRILDGAARALAPGGRALLFVGRDSLAVAERSPLRLEERISLPQRSASYLVSLRIAAQK